MFYRVVIPLAGRSPEELWERLAAFAVEGVEESDDSAGVYFTVEEEARRAAEALGGRLPEAMAEQNWSAEWQAGWEAIPVGERFFLCPPWQETPAPAGRIRLEMVPGNVFGGGDHPTTQLCLELLETCVRRGERVADIGAGTGILTRAVWALGGHGVGCDIDPAAIGMVDFAGSADALASNRFGGVIANIHLGVLRELRGELQRLMAPGAWLLVSGFLPEQSAEIRSLFGEPVSFRERDGWCAALMAGRR